MTYPIRLKYSEEHVWVRVEGETAKLGITDYAQDRLGDILYIDLPEIDKVFSAGDIFAEIESAKETSKLPIPLSGRIVDVNEALSDAPEIINEEAYNAWIVEIELSDTSELDSLLSASEYEAGL